MLKLSLSLTFYLRTLLRILKHWKNINVFGKDILPINNLLTKSINVLWIVVIMFTTMSGDVTNSWMDDNYPKRV